MASRSGPHRPYSARVHRRALSLLLLIGGGCSETRGAEPGPLVRLASCNAPACASSCACDHTTSCDPECDDCDPECGRCLAPGARCRLPAQGDAGVLRGDGSEDGGAAESDGGGARVDAGSAEPVRIRIARAWEASSFVSSQGQRIRGPGGTRYVFTDLELDNASELPAPLLATFFIAVTSAGIEFSGGPETPTIAGGCPQNGSVSPGQSARCTVVFSVTGGARVGRLEYRGPPPLRGGASIDAEPCLSCGAECVDPKTDPDHCGRCDQRTEGGRCEDGQPACTAPLSACPTGCVDLSQDPLNCGRCGQAVSPGMACVRGALVCTASPWEPDSLLACDGRCVPNSSENCGACGRNCGSGSCIGTCSSASCAYSCESRESTAPTSCASICAADRLSCIEGQSRALYRCPDGSLAESHGPCSAVPPQTIRIAGPNQTCTWTEQDCGCR